MRHVDPAAMTASERLDEIAELLARGAQRYFAGELKDFFGPQNSRDRLDVPATVEAPCGARVQSPQITRTTA